MIKQIPTLLVLVGIVVIIIGFNLVMTYGLSFYTGIALFFGIAMIISGINLKMKIKKLVSKNQKKQYDYTIKKMTEDILEDDVPKKESKEKKADFD
ncbi:MAG: hypothetical protein ACW9XB_01335 [Candidatus Nitrosopumilus sp. metabat.KBP569_Feb_25m_nospike.7]|nr:hypothetical protein [Nitrosopumilus sp.]MDC4228915.1 hypothetical protein [Nitrosopumilus sp.]